MPVTHAQETCTRHYQCHWYKPRVIWYQKLARVSVNLVQTSFFLVQLSCTELSTALFYHRNWLACDTNCATWLAGELFWCKQLWWTCVKFFVQVSGTAFLSMRRRHNWK